MVEKLQNGTQRFTNVVLAPSGVNLLDDAFDEYAKTGTAYPFEEFKIIAQQKPEVLKRRKTYDRVMRDGTTEQWVKVFRESGSSMSLREGERRTIQQRTTLDDGSMDLNGQMVRQNYEQAGKEIFGDVKRKM